MQRPLVARIARMYDDVMGYLDGIDTVYVAESGRDWKLHVESDNWWDTYTLSLDGPDPMRIHMASDLYTSLGGYLQWHIFSVGYSKDITNWFYHSPMKHDRFETGLNFSRFQIEAFNTRISNGAWLRTFGDYNDGEWFRQYFPGMSMHNFGLSAYYFFNHARYSHAAAYNFTRIQLRSAGSWLAGLSYSNLDLTLDYTQLPEYLLPYWSYRTAPDTYRFHYHSAGVLFGYAYNCVLSPHWLLNGTFLPRIGINHNYQDASEGLRNLLSLNASMRFSLSYTRGDIFTALIGKVHGHLYHSQDVSLTNTLHDFSLLVGYRF